MRRSRFLFREKERLIGGKLLILKCLSSAGTSATTWYRVKRLCCGTIEPLTEQQIKERNREERVRCPSCPLSPNTRADPRTRKRILEWKRAKRARLKREKQAQHFDQGG